MQLSTQAVPVDQSLVVEPDEGCLRRFAEHGVHREALMQGKGHCTYLAQFGAIGINMFNKNYQQYNNFNTNSSYFNVFLLLLDHRTYLES